MYKYKCIICSKQFIRDWQSKDRPSPKYCSRGCYGKGREQKHKKLIGEKLGKLTVKHISEIRSKNGQICVLCKCECGNEKLIPVHHIEEGIIRSCGCWKIGKERTFPTFNKKIEKIEGCWKWKGQINKAGYGRHCGKYAHRLSYEYYKGKIPEDKMICHTCNNKSCVNPDHMYLGTAKENAQDALKAGVLYGRNTRKRA